MSKYWVCDFCGVSSQTSTEMTMLGKNWNDYDDSLGGLEACDKCWKVLEPAYHSTDEVEAIRTKNVKAAVEQCKKSSAMYNPDLLEPKDTKQ